MTILMKMLAISGSLRVGSSNTALLEAAKQNAPSGIQVEVFPHLEEIPAFNPDRENDPPPPSVAALREGMSTAGAVLFSTPEYAHGVPGVLKNALDWVVGSGELYEKPVALLHVSSRGEFARASLKETLAIMGTKLVFDGEVTTSELRATLEKIAASATAHAEARAAS
jgi:NAD(P)H-dependent FMN reductase